MGALALHLFHCWIQFASVSVYIPPHCFNHTLDLVLIYGIEIDHLRCFPQNYFLSDHYFITFELLTYEYTVTGKHFYLKSLSDDTVTCIELIPLVLDSLPCPTIVESPLIKPSPPQIDHFYRISDTLQKTLEA